VDIVEGDIADAEPLRAVLDGGRAVVIAVAAMTRKLFPRLWEIEHDAVLRAFEEAERAGVSRVVLLSIYDVDLDFAARLDLAAAPLKAQVEQELFRSGLNGTVLGQPASMEIFFAFIRGGRVMAVPGGGPPALPTIAPQDTGVIAVQAALRDDLGGRRLRLAGPEALSFPAAAERIGRIWGRRIRFVRIPLALPLGVRRLLRPWRGDRTTAAFLYTMLGYVRLLNEPPPGLVSRAAEDHRRLLETFSLAPTTLEMMARSRLPRAGGS